MITELQSEELQNALSDIAVDATSLEFVVSGDEPDYLSALHDAWVIIGELHDLAERLATYAKEAGASWADIGHAWGGMTRQGAFDKWSPREPALPSEGLPSPLF